ncbi:hypothetical protein CSB37_01845 [bacterium DOLZORAL124_38_8]|nr:MAG: hypothetical protein CSB37_01845 [bacterium DOLZORAL124_38_8]
MKKILFGFVAFSLLVGSSVLAQEEKPAKTFLSQAEVKKKAKLACSSKVVQRLVYDRAKMEIVVQNPASADKKEVDQYGFEDLESGLLFLGYWYETIDGVLSDEQRKEAAEMVKNGRMSDAYFVLNKGHMVNSNNFLCPDPRYAEESYKRSTASSQSVFLKQVCRKNLLVLAQEGCQNNLNKLKRDNYEKIQKIKVDYKPEQKEKYLQALKTILPDYKETFVWPITPQKNKPVLSARVELWKKFVEQLSDIKSELDNNEKLKSKQKKSDSALLNSLESKITELQVAVERFDNHVKENEKEKTVPKVLKSQSLQEYLKSREFDLKALKELFAEQNKKIKEEVASNTGNKTVLRHKISYIQTRIRQLAFSDISDGASSFNVSGVLVSKTAENGKVSREGRWSLFESGENNFFDKIIKLVAGVAGTLGVVILIIGIVFLVVANGDDTQITKGKELILYALGGLFVVFISFIVIQFVIDLLVW